MADLRSSGAKAAALEGSEYSAFSVGSRAIGTAQIYHVKPLMTMHGKNHDAAAKLAVIGRGELWADRCRAALAGGDCGCGGGHGGQAAGAAVGIALECGAGAPGQDGGQQSGDGIAVSCVGEGVMDVV